MFYVAYLFCLLFWNNEGLCQIVQDDSEVLLKREFGLVSGRFLEITGYLTPTLSYLGEGEKGAMLPQASAVCERSEWHRKYKGFCDSNNYCDLIVS